MGKIVISENVTLDGIVQDPTGEEGFDRGGWFGRMGEDDRQAWGSSSSRRLSRPRRCYEWADRLNAMPKHVVSSTVDAPRWATERPCPARSSTRSRR